MLNVILILPLSQNLLGLNIAVGLKQNCQSFVKGNWIEEGVQAFGDAKGKTWEVYLSPRGKAGLKRRLQFLKLKKRFKRLRLLQI